MDAEVATARGPHRLWPEWRADALVALVVVVLQVLATIGAARHQHARMTVPAVLLLAVGPVALLVRRRHPVAVYAVVFLSTLAYWTADFPKGPIFFALIVAFVWLDLTGRRAIAVGSIVLGWAAFLWLPVLLGRDSGPSLGGVVGLAAWLLVLLSGSEIARARREHAVDQARTREEATRRRASEERVRIAQDLHDVLAHNISLINVQAGVALHLGDELPAPAREAFQAIKTASRDALGELRSVLDILRDPGHDLPRAPVPGLADVDALVARVDAAGLPVACEVTGSARPLPTSVDVAAYRIVQEALTNVVRHAGPAHARVLIEYRSDEVVVEVVDDGVGARNGRAGDGNGIAGMRERAAAVGGSLEAASRAGGGFRVRAALPVSEPA